MMHDDRIQRATSNDGTEIVGRVRGQGPPLVLVHGSLEDGDLCWDAMMPFLSERFTCYLISTRGRGLSGGDSDSDLSPERLVEDVTAFVESIGEPVALAGESAGGMLALGTASRSIAVAAVAAYEPVVFEVFSEQNAELLEQTIGRVGEATAEGRMGDAARLFAEPLVNEDEMNAISATSYFEDAGRYVPIMLEEMQQSTQSHDYSPTDPKLLEQISVPVLLLQGSQSALRPWFTDGVRHVADHVADPETGELAGAGHWAPVLQPEKIANEFIRFFEAEPAT